MNQFLPEEIVVTILTNLRADCLSRFKCVSKQWCHLISEILPTRSRKLFTKSWHNGRRYFQSIDQETLEVVDVDIPWEDRESSRFQGSCNGLLLVKLSDDLLLWNPYTRYHQKILSYKNLSGDYRSFGGSCFDSIKKEYKVVMCLSLKTYGRPGDEFVMVGSPRDKSWTHVDFPYSEVRPGPVLNNHVHWLAHMKDSLPLDFSLIIYFDIKVGGFVEFQTPIWLDIRGFEVLDGCLCISCRDICDDTFQVMAMKEYGVHESWTVLFRIKEPFFVVDSITPFFYLNGNKSEVLMSIRATPGFDIISGYDTNSNSDTDDIVMIVNNLCHEIVYDETSVKPIGYDWEELDSRGEAFYVEKFVSNCQRTMKKDKNGCWYAEEDSEESKEHRGS